MKSLSEKRLIINGTINGKQWPFLVDTGASIALIDSDSIKKAGLTRGKSFSGTIVGAGGEIENLYYCKTLIDFGGKYPIGLFILSDISHVLDSIKRETGIKILGILSLPLMKLLGITIDPMNNEINIPQN